MAVKMDREREMYFVFEIHSDCILYSTCHCQIQDTGTRTQCGTRTYLQDIINAHF